MVISMFEMDAAAPKYDLHALIRNVVMSCVLGFKDGGGRMLHSFLKAPLR